MNDLINAILDGDVALTVIEVNKLLNANIKPEQIITEAFERVITELDKKCTIELFNLLEIMLAGRAILAIVRELYPKGVPSSQIKGIVVIGVIEGDIHDLGKNVVKIMLIGSGYRVIDCGIDCPIEEIINIAEKEGADAIFISGLISTIIPKVKMVKPLLAQRDLTKIKVFAGGGALKQSTPEKLNVDFVGESVFDGLNHLNKILHV